MTADPASTVIVGAFLRRIASWLLNALVHIVGWLMIGGLACAVVWINVGIGSMSFEWEMMLRTLYQIAFWGGTLAAAGADFYVSIRSKKRGSGDPSTGDGTL